MTELLFGSGSDIGHRSNNNEDSFCAAPELGLWLIADGMGGHEAGEVASAIVSETIVEAVRSGVNLIDAIQQAHSAVIAASQHGQGALGMGSTVVALQIKSDEFEVAWVGDSRAYLWNGELRQISRDHSYVQKLLDSGAITEEEALHHPNRNIITQSLGADLDEVIVDNVTGQLCQGQKVLLCSDGLNDEVQDSEIAAILQEGGDEQTIVNNLINSALTHGGKDNVSVILVSSPGDAFGELQGTTGSTQDVEGISREGSTENSTDNSTVNPGRSNNPKLWIGVSFSIISLIVIIFIILLF
ncbi:MAG: serine/threonine-protein phosphatase [Gammaproteobacteria bacterium]|nr:serine/threonine-protein phosphatase [Gammaproteobacteria bacterium]